MRKDLNIFITLLLICSIFLLGYSAKQDIAPTLKNSKIDTTITIPQGNFDIGNKQQGTITISMDSNYYQELISQNSDKNVKYFIFFSSKIMPGLEIRYNVEEEIFEAGIPPFKTAKVNLLNGEYHLLAFTYQLGDKQSIYFDGQPIGQRHFLNPNDNLISGFAIKRFGTFNEIIDESLVSKITIADYVMTPEQVRLQRNS